ncbi:MAG: hypothetical protein HZB18_01820 [Chloroflexi bacterium]|nr:hypothetical protein [Chloroflexota bacterium]
MVVRNYLLLLILGVWIFAETGCTPNVTPTIHATFTVQQAPTATAFIEMPEISNPLVQAEGESVEEFVVRIAARRIINKRPFLIVLSQMENKNNFWFGVSPEVKDKEKCWLYEVDSVRQCANEDIQNKLNDNEFPKIFFAFAYSNSTEKLYILDYHHPWVEEDSVDGYRLVIEFQGDKWIEKSIASVY